MLEDVSLVARIVLSVIFIMAAVSKLGDLKSLKMATAGFGIPMPLASLAIVIPVLELAVAGALLIDVSSWVGAVGSLALLSAFSIAISINLMKGRKPECNCFGQLHSSPIGWNLLLRNAIFGTLAVVIVLLSPQIVNPGYLGSIASETVTTLMTISGSTVNGTNSWFSLSDLILVALGLVAAGSLLVIQLYHHNRQLSERLRILQSRLDGVAPLDDDRQIISSKRLTTASEVPTKPAAFNLPGVDGKTYSLNSLLAKGIPLLILFTDPRCGPCNELFPKIQMWQRQYSNILTISIITTGTFEVNREKAEHYGLQNVLVQHGRELSKAYGIYGTPSGVLVKQDGTFWSTVVAGTDAISSLVSKVLETRNTQQGNEHKLLLESYTRRQTSTTTTITNTSSTSITSKVSLPAPLFRLLDINGKIFDIQSLHGNKALIIFWSPDCTNCDLILSTLLSELEKNSSRYNSEPIKERNNLKIVIISTGMDRHHQLMNLSLPVLFDSDFRTGHRFGARSIPSAVLIDEKGMISSNIAYGASAVLKMAGIDSGSPSITIKRQPIGIKEEAFTAPGVSNAIVSNGGKIKV